MVPFMVRLAHHERVDWVGLPRAGGLGGLITSGISGVARMKRSAIRDRFRSWPLEECADRGTSPFMVRLAHHERVGCMGSPRTGEL